MVVCSDGGGLVLPGSQRAFPVVLYRPGERRSLLHASGSLPKRPLLQVRDIRRFSLPTNLPILSLLDYLVYWQPHNEDVSYREERVPRRATPLAKSNLKAKVLAIGDGANDVSMIPVRESRTRGHSPWCLLPSHWPSPRMRALSQTAHQWATVTRGFCRAQTSECISPGRRACRQSWRPTSHSLGIPSAEKRSQ